MVLAIVLCFSLLSIGVQAEVQIPAGGLVIFDKADLVITVTSVNRDRNGYVTDIDFTITNNGTEEKSVRTVPNVWSVVKINDFTFKANLDATVAAGKTAREKLRLDNDEAKLFGLKDVFEITMQFQTYKTENYIMKNIVKYEPSTITLSQDYTHDFNNGNLVFSNQAADIYSCGFISTYHSDKAVFVVKNKTGSDRKFCFASLSTNGFMNKEDEVSEDIFNDTYRILYVPLDEDFSKDNVKEIEFTLKTSAFLDIISTRYTEYDTVTVNYQQGSPSPVEKPSAWAETQVDQAVDANLVPKSLQSKYTQAITRSEFCALAVALYETVNGEITGRKSFTDTTDVNVEKCAYIGVVSGMNAEETIFSPDSQLTREQAAAMLSRLALAIGKPLTPKAATFSDNSSISFWAFDAVGQMQASGIMSGVGNNTFAPKSDYTREQSILTILRLYNAVK